MTMIGVYYMTSQPFEVTRFFMVLCIAVLTSLVAQSIGLLIGAGLSIEVSLQSFYFFFVSIPSLVVLFFVTYMIINVRIIVPKFEFLVQLELFFPFLE